MRDRRTFARSKIATIGANRITEAEFSAFPEVEIESVQGSYKTLRIRSLENVNLSEYNYALMSFIDSRGVFDLKTGKFCVVYRVLPDDLAEGYVRCNTNVLYGRDYNRVDIVREGNCLVAKQVHTSTIDCYEGTPIKIRLV